LHVREQREALSPPASVLRHCRTLFKSSEKRAAVPARELALQQRHLWTPWQAA
jgi:hypothetical protein